ncbi:MAG: divalent metal cation transporter [Pseudomonadota bacterium]|nr:divalent metal cation transporter [Pseudomonadota bacterium]
MTTKTPKLSTSQDTKQPPTPRLMEVLGPGLITGASDDDPSGIATYSQVGAQFGYSIGWTLIFTYPLMCVIQLISAEIGRVTGHGIAGNLRRHYRALWLYSLVALLVIANVINIGADLGAMGAALKLLIGGPAHFYVAIFGVISVLLEIFMRYARYVSILKWLTLSLFAYVATVFTVHVPWGTVAQELFWPTLSFNSAYLTAVLAVFGTTISPYLFFWQAGSEVEREREIPGRNALKDTPSKAKSEMRRMKIDTFVGMFFSNLVAVFIVLTTAATLHASGQTDIQTSAQAAEALKPLAGRFAYCLFALGIIGTGLLALPVLSGSAAYALGEAFQWPVGLAKKPYKARAFYGTIAVATLLGGALNLTPIDPVKALFWSAVLNGVVAVPIMAMLMFMAANKAVMGRYTITTVTKVLGWVATFVMALVAVGMMATWGN